MSDAAPMRTEPTHWQCTCGQWVPIGYGAHPHVVSKLRTWVDLHAQRRAMESGLQGIGADVLEDATVSYVFRTKDMLTR